MLKTILKKVNRIEEHIFKQQHNCEASSINEGTTTASEDFIHGVNISSLPAKDAYAYALILLDSLFTKEELGCSLMYKSPKSSKPALDNRRVNQLISLVQKRYKPHEYNMKILISKM